VDSGFKNPFLRRRPTMAKKVGTKKVGTQKKGSKSKGEEKPRGKKEFEFQGEKLTVTPENPVPEGYSFEEHKPLKKNQFEESWMFTAWQAAQAEHRVEQARQKAEALKAKAEKERTMGDEKTRKAAKRAVRLTQELEKLSQSLEDSGVDLDELVSLAKKEKEAKEEAQSE
jgi:hypothetical protein